MEQLGEYGDEAISFADMFGGLPGYPGEQPTSPGMFNPEATSWEDLLKTGISYGLNVWNTKEQIDAQRGGSNSAGSVATLPYTRGGGGGGGGAIVISPMMLLLGGALLFVVLAKG